MEADCTQGALVLFRYPEIRCSKKSVIKVMIRGRERYRAALHGGAVPHPAIRGWVSLGIGQISKNI